MIANNKSVHRITMSMLIWRDSLSALLKNSILTKSPTLRYCGTFLGKYIDDIFRVEGFSTAESRTENGIPLFTRSLNESAASEQRMIDFVSEEVDFQPDIVGIWSDCEEVPVFYRKEAQIGIRYSVLESVFYDPTVDQFSRIEGIFETQKLSGKLVTIIGLGTGGAVCANELVRCAVDRFRLVDFDRIDAHNIVRHTCGVSDIGRFKTKAVADQLRDINPCCKIETFETDVCIDSDLMYKVVYGSALVLVCTDNNRSMYHINECCLRLDVPAVYAGAFERAIGGMVIRVIPGQTACFDCVFGRLQESVKNRPPPRKGNVSYSNISDPSEFKAEPGLSIDVHLIALIMAKVSLLTLLRGVDTELEDIPYDFLLWGNRKDWIFPEPFYCKFAVVNPRNDCDTCQSVNLDQDEKESVLQEVNKIIKTANFDPELFKQGRNK